MLSPLRAKKSDNYKDSNKKNKQRTVTKIKARKLKSNNFTRKLGTLQKTHMLISQCWEKEEFDSTKIISNFG